MLKQLTFRGDSDLCELVTGKIEHVLIRANSEKLPATTCSHWAISCRQLKLARLFPSENPALYNRVEWLVWMVRLSPTPRYHWNMYRSNLFSFVADAIARTFITMVHVYIMKFNRESCKLWVTLVKFWTIDTNSQHWLRFREFYPYMDIFPDSGQTVTWPHLYIVQTTTRNFQWENPHVTSFT